MTTLIEDKLQAIIDLCTKHRVRTLAVFGSAARDDFDPGRSDVDLIVDFQEMDPAEHMRAYFDLAEGLEALLGVKVDLIERKPISNPYFRREVEETQAVLYEAA